MPSHVVRFWIVVAVATSVVVWAIAPVLAPFVWGAGVAYLLRPLCRLLEKAGMKPWVASIAPIGGFFAAVLGVVALLVPFLWSQAVALAVALPAASVRVSEILQTRWDTLREHVDPDTLARAEAASSSYLQHLGSAAGSLLRGLLSSGFAIVDLATFAVLTPLVAYYLLVEWDRIVAWVDDLLPDRWSTTVRSHMRDIDRVLSAWIRWQSVVCLILACYYAIGLGLTGMRFGVLIGLVTGLLAFVPFVGFMAGLVACIVASALSFHDWHGWAAVGAVLLVGNVLDGWVLIPRLLGRKMGLHDVWVLFALLVGGHLLGLLGVALAVPGAAVAGVLLRSMLARYRISVYHRERRAGLAAEADASPQPGIPAVF